MDEAREAVDQNLHEWSGLMDAWRNESGAVEAPPGLDEIARQALP